MFEAQFTVILGEVVMVTKPKFLRVHINVVPRSTMNTNDGTDNSF